MLAHHDELIGIMDFLRRAEGLKDTLRLAWTTNGRQESAAEHSWRLTLFAMLAGRYFPELDQLVVLKMSVIHDLGEIIGGDIPAPEQQGSKAGQEREDLRNLLRPLPEELRTELMDLWEDYEAARTPEARLVKALDKFETLMQHSQGPDMPKIDFAFNLHYGEQYTRGNELFDLMREVLDQETECCLLARNGRDAA